MTNLENSLHTIGACLDLAKTALTPISETPMLDAEVILSHILNQSRSYLYARPLEVVSIYQANAFFAAIRRRCQLEPIAYITGQKEFWSLEFSVNDATLIPRPETELLVETALNLFDKNIEKLNVLDLGTGSGAIAIALAHERPNWTITATDICNKALKVAKRNAKILLIDNIHFINSDWCNGLPRKEFDIMVSNPPYIAETEWEFYKAHLQYEPRLALVSGHDGLNAIKIIAQSAKHHLKPGGYLMIEHGFSQGKLVREIFSKETYKHIASLPDSSGLERMTVGVCP